jgi:hypothetical protein
MKLYFRLVLVFLISCQSRQEKTVTVTSSMDTIPFVDTAQITNDVIFIKNATQPEEFFADSLNIGRKSFNKIEISKYRTLDSNYVVIKFYTKRNGKWHIKNDFQFEKDGVVGCDTKLADFNNDGLNDMTYISAVAARGANEVRRLFIYDKHQDKLIFLKNSDDYPNMLYNKELNCIDAFLVYGGCSTVFLNISGDSLKEFASVELFEGLTVRTYDKKGKEKIILQDTTNKAVYIRYKNFRPLREYDDY